MEIIKSSRHQRIIGIFGEALLCNWLSRSGFEVTVVDHTGIDVVAYNPNTGQRLGISVKSRTRRKGTETASVTIFSSEKKDRRKVLDACKAFACEPWIAIYVESSEFAHLFVLSVEHYDQEYRGKANRAIDDWKMGEKHKRRYESDPDVKHIHMEFSRSSWNWA